MVFEKKKIKDLFYILCLIPVLIYFILNEEIKKYLNKKPISLDEIHIEIPEFRLNPEWSICDKHPQTQTYLFISFVIISPNQFEQRNIIRKTWAKKEFASDVKVIFTVGLSKNQTINELLLDEFNTYGDILQIENLMDSYYNCTIKIMKTFKWITKYCSNTRYILKICDDVVVNTPQLINTFKNLVAYKLNHIYGNGFYGTFPIRDPGSKWYVSEKEYSEKDYPPYMQGIIQSLF